MKRITIIGTGLIGASIGLALREQSFGGEIFGWDKNPAELAIALSRGAIDHAVEDPITAATGSDLILLAGPVFSILEWIDQLGPLLGPHQLVTDVGSVKGAVSEHASRSFGGAGQAQFLPGHPMAGKEVHGAENAEAALFQRRSLALHTAGIFFSANRTGSRMARLGHEIRLPHSRPRRKASRRTLRLGESSSAAPLNRIERHARRQIRR